MVTRLARQGLRQYGHKEGSMTGPEPAAGVSPQSRSSDKLVRMRHKQICSYEARLRPRQEVDPQVGNKFSGGNQGQILPSDQHHREEIGLKPSWEVVHGSWSGSMRSMARHRRGCDRVVNRHTNSQSSSDRF